MVVLRLTLNLTSFVILSIDINNKDSGVNIKIKTSGGYTKIGNTLTLSLNIIIFSWPVFLAKRTVNK